MRANYAATELPFRSCGALQSFSPVMRDLSARPLTLAGDCLRDTPPTLRIATASLRGARRVLVIEDDPASREALCAILESRSWKVMTASTVVEAMYLLPSEPQHLLLDLMLPDGDGEKILRLVNQRKLSTKVTVLTAMSDPNRMQRLMDLHPHSMLMKPIDVGKLMQIMSPIYPA